MSTQKELAYRYDLFITPEWRDRFDTLINETARIPVEGRILDVNTGTGSHAIELATQLKGEGEVIGVDPHPERLEIARAKALVKKLEAISFQEASPTALPFGEGEFDAVIGDASLVPSGQVGEVLSEMLRVAKPGAKVVLKLATRGSFDEFFSIYWEALLGLGIVEEVWASLEAFIKERPTVSDAVEHAKEIGLRKADSVSSREEFAFETGSEFLESPLIRDTFLSTWLSIVPEEQRGEVSDRIASIIERERAGLPFEVSIKATLIHGIK
ncbi:MAG TPA: class I SAM-dependent methyltransferase [Blastocatellia bacterium]|nr:class I SAM-dependent methyltransferase [Blastocatellia bacterium]